MTSKGGSKLRRSMCDKTSMICVLQFSSFLAKYAKACTHKLVSCSLEDKSFALPCVSSIMLIGVERFSVKLHHFVKLQHVTQKR